ncbi:MAG: OmpH family outer membrane protein [Akkermansiaceae bacterium]
MSAVAELRCATVNIDKVFKNYIKAREKRDALHAEQKKHTQRLATLTERRSKVSKAMDELRKEIQLQAKNEADKETYRDQAQKLHDQYKSLSQAITELENLHLKQSKKDLQSLLKTSLSEIHTIIKQHAQNQQYDWVIDTSGVSSSTISPLIYARDAQDITSDILKQVNQ